MPKFEKGDDLPEIVYVQVVNPKSKESLQYRFGRDIFGGIVGFGAGYLAEKTWDLVAQELRKGTHRRLAKLVMEFMRP